MRSWPWTPTRTNGSLGRLAPAPVPGAPPSGRDGTIFADLFNSHVYPESTGHLSPISQSFNNWDTQLSSDFVTTYAHSYAGYANVATVKTTANIIVTEFGYRGGTQVDKRSPHWLGGNGIGH